MEPDDIVLQVLAPLKWSLEIERGKYRVDFYENGRFLALRYGEPWRDLTGDKFVLCLCQEIMSLREKAGKYDEMYDELSAFLEKLAARDLFDRGDEE